MQAHFGWCASVGGPGWHPSSVEAAIAAAKAWHPTPPPPPPVSPQTNNGWWKPKRPASTSAVEECPSDAMHVNPQTGKRASLRLVTDSPRPGQEINKDMRVIVGRLLDQGWRYEGRQGGPCAVISPEGKRVGVPTASQKFSNKQIVGKVRRAGGEL